MSIFKLAVVRPHKDRPADLLWEESVAANTVSEAVRMLSRNIPDDAKVYQQAYLKAQRAA